MPWFEDAVRRARLHRHGINEEWFAAAAVYRLLVDPASWIHRRVESISFTDDRIVRRRVSLDLTVPRILSDFPIDDRLLPFLPLTLLRKGPLRNFDLDSAAGTPVPVLTKAENEDVVARSLEILAEAIIGRTVEREVAERLFSIVSLPPTTAEQELASWESLGAQASAEGATWQQLLTSEPFMDYATALTKNFVLLADAPSAPGERRIFKLGYDEAFVDEPQLINRLTRGLAWRPTKFDFEAAAVLCASYHFEVAAPRDLQIASARLCVRNDDDHVTHDVADESPGSRAHLYIAGVEEGSDATVTVELQARRSGLVRASLLVSALAFLMLLGGYLRLDQIANPTQTPTSAGLLLLVPTLLAAYIVRPGEHQLASTLLLGVRATVALAAAAAVLASALLVAGLATCSSWWFVPLSVAGACTAGLLVSYIRS